MLGEDPAQDRQLALAVYFTAVIPSADFSILQNLHIGLQYPLETV